MTDSGYRLRQYYIDKRREYHPGYKPDARVENRWDDIASFILGFGCDLEKFVAAAFLMCQRRGDGRYKGTARVFPFPTELKTTMAVEWYRQYVESVFNADPLVQRSENTSTVSFLSDVHAAELENTWHHYKRYLAQAEERGFTIEEALASDFIPFAAWFRLLYRRPAPDALRLQYFDEARQEIFSNPHLQKFLIEKLGVATLEQLGLKL
jgi:hypothetical protein